ncbi:hypothetical protein [Thalassococcus sp. S3]|uniref:hypothetical protein n=1 Tax=Thalassococcus sp. S3 TaxID=2017482 RepID=UPI0010246CA6|nr:hypothetical protein [Thalassococcus sp. S3]QBF31534.1 hypothetical protein CFI11_09940 [Thalassococcus sp. S3]
MSFKPKTKLEREMWAYLKAHRRVTKGDLFAHCQDTEWAKQRLFGRLRKEGHILDADRDGSTHYFTVFTEAQSRHLEAGKRKSYHGVIWRAMRVLREFSPKDIAASLIGSEKEVTESEIQLYCTLLARAGYLKVLRKRDPGVRPALYRLQKDTGILPPTKKQRMVLVDPNEDRVVYVEGAHL